VLIEILVLGGDEGRLDAVRYGLDRQIEAAFARIFGYQRAVARMDSGGDRRRLIGQQNAPMPKKYPISLIISQIPVPYYRPIARSPNARGLGSSQTKSTSPNLSIRNRLVFTATHV
jgi:hypothetical protein